MSEENRGRDRQRSDYSQPNKRKRISTGNKPYDKVDYNRPTDDKKPLYSSDKSYKKPRDDSREYPRENYRRSSDDSRGSGYDRRDRGDRSYNNDRPYNDRPYEGERSFNNDSAYNDKGTGYERGNTGYERNTGNGYERRQSNDRGQGYDRGQGQGYDRGQGQGYDRGQGRPFTRRSSDSGGQRSGYKKPFNREGRPEGGRPFRKSPPVQQNLNRRQPVYKVEDLPGDVPLRLNKYIANTGLCSRREADEYIEAGLISVNGVVNTTLGSKILPTDDIRYNGERLQPERKVYILLNKPKDYVTSVDDPHAKRTVMELIRGACRERIYPVGRLDRMTTGVLLLTNDGELTKKLTHPVSNIRKIYQAHLDKNLKPEDLQAIAEGISLDDGFIRIDGVNFISEEDRSLIGVEIHSGRNRIVRRIFEHFGYKVTKLDRVYFAGLTKKGLQRGNWRYLDPKEVGFLKMMKA